MKENNCRSFICNRASNLKQGAIRAMFDKASTMNGVISMGIGEPDMATPAHICEACMEALNKGITHYTPNAGMQQLRIAISQSEPLKKLQYDPLSEIIITNGGMGALSLLVSVVIEEGDEVLVQDPQWLNYAAQVKYYGGTVVRIPTCASDRFQMKAEEIKKRITSKTKMLIINSPCNPTGEVMDSKTLADIADIARQYHILVVSDEVYNTLLYDGIKAKSISHLPGMREQCVVINSFSKSFAMTGWRIGYAAGPAEIIDRMTKAQENLNACANAPGQYAAAYALEHMEYSEELRKIFEKRRKLVLDGIASINGMNVNKPQGAFYVFPDISAFGLDSTSFCNKLLEEQKVVCIPGGAFGECGEGFIRVSYTAQEEDLKCAIERLRLFCQKL